MPSLRVSSEFHSGLSTRVMFLREPSKFPYTYEGEASWILHILQVDRSLQSFKGHSSLRILNHIREPVKGARHFHLKMVPWGKDDRSMDLVLHLRKESSEKTESLGARVALREYNMTTLEEICRMEPLCAQRRIPIESSSTKFC